jgi:hypothetical protein
MQKQTMFKFEQCKLFMSGDIEELQDQYNLWFRNEMGERKKTPVLADTPINIFSRELAIRNYEGEETFVLAVFYEHYDVMGFAKGADRGQHYTGGSAFGPKKGGKR